MKNKFLAIAVVLLSVVGLTANAQMKIGAGLTYATELNGLGISVNGTYQFNEQWEAAPSIAYYFKKDYTTWWSIDFAGHYNFKSDDKMSLYGLGGLELLTAKVDLSEFGLGSVSDTNIGLLLGGGGHLSLNDKLTGFGELKLAIMDGTYIGFNFGVLYSLDK